MNPQVLQETLLINSPILLSVAKDLVDYSWYLMPAILLWALAVEYLGEMDFSGTLKRAIFSMLILALYIPIHMEVINTSLSLADKFLDMPKYSSNIFTKLDNFKKARFEIRKEVRSERSKKEDKSEGVISKSWGDIIQEVRFLRDDFLSGILWILVRLCLLFLKFVYSSIYHFAYAFTGIIALIHVFNFGAKSVGSALKSTLWCALMPWVVAATLIFLGSAYESFKLVDGNSFEELLLLVAVGVMLLFTPVITAKLMDGSGVSAIGEKLGKMAATSLLTGGVATIASRVGTWSKSTFSNMKDSVFFKSNIIKERSPKTASEIAASKNSLCSLKEGKGLSEKCILASNQVINPFKAREVEKQKKQAANALHHAGRGDVVLKNSDAVKNIEAGKFGPKGSQEIFFRKSEQHERQKEAWLKSVISPNKKSTSFTRNTGDIKNHASAPIRSVAPTSRVLQTPKSQTITNGKTPQRNIPRKAIYTKPQPRKDS